MTAAINQAVPTQLSPVHHLSGLASYPVIRLRSSGGDQDGIPVGYRLVTLIGCRLCDEPEESSAPSSLAAVVSGGHRFLILGLLLDEAQYDREFHLKDQVVDLVRQAVRLGSRDPQGWLQRNNPAWKLSRVETSISIDRKTKIVTAFGEA